MLVQRSEVCSACQQQLPESVPPKQLHCACCPKALCAQCSKGVLSLPEAVPALSNNAYNGEAAAACARLLLTAHNSFDMHCTSAAETFVMNERRSTALLYVCESCFSDNR